MEGIIADVLREIKPNWEERKKLNDVANRVVELVNDAAKKLKVDAFGTLVGSAARNTWLSGERDIDVFIMLPETMSREELEEIGMEIAKKVAPSYEERYAEHPYIRFRLEGCDIDLVPCFNIKNPTEIRSAVDRTPFHNEYILKHLDKMDEALLLKQFLHGIGVYGAELKVQGFSGYLCEISILRYKSFLNVLKNASGWKYGERIDIEGNGSYEGSDPLVVIDPVDPKRNVAAAVSVDSFSIFIDRSRSFLANPSRSYFFPPDLKPVSRSELLEKIHERGTELITILFDVPFLVEDILFPQLRKSERSIVDMLEREGFRVLRSDAFASSSKAVILLEMEVSNLPNIKKHIGPPTTSENAEIFKRKHENVYIEGGRFIAMIPRRYTHAKDLLEREIGTCSLGKNISHSIKNGEVRKNEEIILFDGFNVFMRKYFN